MNPFWIFLSAAAILVLLVLLIAYLCYRMAFYAPRKEPKHKEEYPIPEGECYEPFREQMVAWMKEARALPCEELEITSFDGLKLHGKYYECDPKAPIELMFHGYRGTAERDLCGGVQRTFSLGRNVLVVDQRTSGKSEGHVITFGVKESKDCLAWVDFMIGHFGPDCKIILCGISMGAATVLMAAGNPLPKNVIGVIADCGYSSAKAIICKVIREDMKLPPFLAYPFVKLGARLFGGFNLEELPPVEAVAKCRVPVLFIHGEADGFVPCSMSRENYAACKAPKKLLTVPGADHGLSYLLDPAAYRRAITEFAQELNY
ncbi:MAG: alpha/beta hydrolase [Clostridiales bacterium]|nr:alpha/beta hydrolase [Clostridiales bacterium]